MEVRVSTLLVSVVVILSLTSYVVEEKIIVTARSRELLSTSILHESQIDREFFEWRGQQV